MSVRASRAEVLSEANSARVVSDRSGTPVAYDKRERGHGRTERRTLKVTAVARGLAFPHAAQAIQVTRRRKVKGKWSRETCYAVTSVGVTPASPDQLAAIIRGHWAIEDRLHWIRDLDFDEDRSQIRTGNGPRIMATLRNLVVTILRLAGATNIAPALRATTPAGPAGPSRRSRSATARSARPGQRRRQHELGSRVEGNLRGPAGNEAGMFPRPLAGQERYLFCHPVADVPRGRRSAWLPYPGEVAALGFPLVGLDPRQRGLAAGAAPVHGQDHRTTLTALHVARTRWPRRPPAARHATARPRAPRGQGTATR